MGAMSDHQTRPPRLRPVFAHYLGATLARYGRAFPDVVRVFLLPFLLSLLATLLEGWTVGFGVRHVPLASVVLAIASWVLSIAAAVGFVAHRADVEGVPLWAIYARGLRLFVQKIWVGLLQLATGVAGVAALFLVCVAYARFAGVEEEPWMGEVALSVVSLAAVVAGAVLGPRLVSAAPALAIEGRRGSVAIARSLELTAGRSLAVLLRLVAGGLATLVAYVALRYVLVSSFGGVDPLTGAVSLSLAGVLLEDFARALLFAPLSLIFGVLLFEDLAAHRPAGAHLRAPLWVFVSVAVFVASLLGLVFFWTSAGPV